MNKLCSYTAELIFYFCNLYNSIGEDVKNTKPNLSLGRKELCMLIKRYDVDLSNNKNKNIYPEHFQSLCFNAAPASSTGF